MDEKVAKTPRPHMLDADEVTELLRIKKGSAYEVIRRINAEREARGRAGAGGYSWVGDIRARVALAKTTARDEA